MTLAPWKEAGLPLHFAGCDGFVRVGSVCAVNPNSIKLKIRGVTQGMVVAIETRRPPVVMAQITSVSDGIAVCEPIEPTRDVAVADRVSSVGARLGAFCGYGLFGRRVDAWGGPAHPNACVVRVDDGALDVEKRGPVSKPFITGIAAIDGLCTLGVGQRVALFSGSGVGKSTLLRSIVEHSQLDAHVVALIGERGREAAEATQSFIQGPKRTTTTLVCATAEASAAQRLGAVRTAIAQAQWLCDRGHEVLLAVDSLTRIAHAWREVALASGESAALRGYPPSLPALIGRIVERAGVRKRGSITAIFSVLVDADDLTEPVTDIVRGLLDGHLVLSRTLANAGRYPPIDILRSSSRLMDRVVTKEHMTHAARVRKALAALERAEDLFAIGAYVSGGDPLLDAAVSQRERLERFIFHEPSPSADTLKELAAIAASLHP